MADISKLIDTIKGSLDVVRPKFPVLPVLLAACSASQKPGLSVNVSYAYALSKLKKLGFVTGKGPDGKPLKSDQYTHTIIQTIFKAFIEDAKIQVSIPAGTITIEANGANAGGPIVAIGKNINNAPVEGSVS